MADDDKYTCSPRPAILAFTKLVPDDGNQDRGGGGCFTVAAQMRNIDIQESNHAVVCTRFQNRVTPRVSRISELQNQRNKRERKNASRHHYQEIPGFGFRSREMSSNPPPPRD